MAQEDIPAVMEIDRQSFPIPWPERSYRFELLENPAATLLVADQAEGSGRRIVGYLGFWLIADEVHISTLAVDPPFRRQGTGEMLLRTALKMAVAKGAKLATLEVRESNQLAVRLYQKLGFSEVGRRKAYYRDNGEDAILMTLGDIRRSNLFQQHYLPGRGPAAE